MTGSSARPSWRASARPAADRFASREGRRRSPSSTRGRKISLSIKARDRGEKQAMAEYGSSDSGASSATSWVPHPQRARRAEDQDD